MLFTATHAEAAEDEVRWRVIEDADSALLVIAADDATDNIGSPSFECKKALGYATASGDTNDSVRRAIGSIILNDKEPGITMVPEDNTVSTVDVDFSYVSGWRYRFVLSVTGPAFEELKRTGTFEFKVGDAALKSKFDVGLKNVARFQELCRLPPRK
ncbi:hypothetical protein LQG66_19600 [Bradyrhizobium ontarionense]|uniref:SRPBCC family protein n=1 Tax=Bradyrhizobium ontarionense TaxID=2898149 RepID=A0ABY3R3B4_9BRAD|nr:hypothetical protein [Bradyrhizobium sp. A19]UFZ01532.1 hypothetical protein LQG66_19600 [Bradyrhizobium sp. A19]